MHLEVVHMARPDEERVGGVGGALIAVTAALHHQAQVIFAGEIHRLGDVVGISSGDRVDARLSGPGVEPSEGLREAG